MPLQIAQVGWLGKLSHEKYFVQEDITRKYKTKLEMLHNDEHLRLLCLIMPLFQ